MNDLSSFIAERHPPLAESPPVWFRRAMAKQPERTMVPVRGADIELLTWGEAGKPGLLLVPGLFAHADWWSMIAPLFLPDYRVAALSLSGMGGSSWRSEYRFEDYAEELFACALAAGLYESGEPPVFIGHSQGGWAVFHSALVHAGRMSAGILIDTGPLRIRPAGQALDPDAPSTPPKLYATEDEAVARFRLDPPQGCDNTFILDHVARCSVRHFRTETGEEGWGWRFDPDFLRRNSLGRFEAQGDPAPLTHILGARSMLLAMMGGDQLPLFRPMMNTLRIEEAGHHVLLDQPIALAAAIRGLLLRR